MKILLPLFFVLLCFAQVDSSSEGEARNLGAMALNFKMHKENYLFPAYVLNGDDTYDAGKKLEAKFQFSLRFSPFMIGNTGINVAYTQKSFWQVYDTDNSRPFRESNYNPEVFIRFGENRAFFTDLGYEHESNGKEDPDSRSWDRMFMRMGVRSANFKFIFKVWGITGEEFYGDQYPERPRSMKYYYGNTEADLGFYALGTIFKAYGRYNGKSGKGYFQGMMLWPLNKKLLWGFNYSVGYGDSLRSYALNHRTYGFGIVLNP